nr:trehalose-6-phosphate synthase [Corynebacterium sp. TAE3-ERU12]
MVVVSNRLPVAPVVDGDEVRWESSPGGLVTALTPVLLAQDGAWVGWPGTQGDITAPEELTTDEGLHLFPVELSAQEYEQFYEGFSNATLWPLLHGLIVTPKYDGDWWESYREVNDRFARAAVEHADEGATIWVQDYQLMLVPGIVRQLRPDVKIGFFLHIPFPAAEIFRQLPWREEIVRGLLGADLVGFQLEECAQNFLELCANIGGRGSSHTGLPDELQVDGNQVTATDGRRVHVGGYPISIDSGSVIAQALNSDAAGVRAAVGNPKHLLLGVDRLDYTKGILQRLELFEGLLDSGALEPEDAVLVQVATPSRERVEDYRRLRAEVEQAVGRINGRYGRLGHPVIHYIHRPVPFARLLDLYSAADVMLVTALRDGMNLVCKEYLACHPDGSGALVLSEFTGAAVELSDAFLCNPHDQESMKRAVMSALSGSQERMSKLHAQVRDHDVKLWASNFLGDLES